MQYFLLITLLYSWASLADQESASKKFQAEKKQLSETFMIAGGPHNFIEKDKLLLAGCEKKCDALYTIKKHSRIGLKEIRKGRTFSNSVGSDVCSQVYHMDSVLGQATDRDRRAFCLFKDGSMVEMNSLSDYLTENEIAF